MSAQIYARCLRQNKSLLRLLTLKISKQFPDKCKIGDVRDIETLRKTITGDVVINLAAVHRDDIGDPSEYQNTNVEGARNIVSVCSEKGIKKIIFTSTVAVYGFAEEAVGEDAPINPFNAYGKTKYLAEDIFREMAI